MSNIKKRLEQGMTTLLLDCDTATMLITRQSVEAIPCTKRVQLRLHLAVCSLCRSFNEQSGFISQQIKQWATIDPEHLDLHLSDEQKNRMKEHLRSAGA
ncbi:MAG: hypothetical protein JXR71_02040 [Bacteroidales bacterium]|nr:hypothetical protein [Bacteroidales bacterium]